MPGLRKLGASLLTRVGVCAWAKGTPTLKMRNSVRANFIDSPFSLREGSRVLVRRDHVDKRIRCAETCSSHVACSQTKARGTQAARNWRAPLSQDSRARPFATRQPSNASLRDRLV